MSENSSPTVTMSIGIYSIEGPEGDVCVHMGV